MVILLMGVSGSGKTTVGRLLAHTLSWQFADADSFHSADNVAKMFAGIPLTDQDRQPWLAALRAAIVKWEEVGDNVVLACSALKQEYRDTLMRGTSARLVFLRGDYSLIEARLALRKNHYMNPALLRSQFETLQEPADATVIDVSAPPEAIVMMIRERLHL